MPRKAASTKMTVDTQIQPTQEVATFSPPPAPIIQNETEKTTKVAKVKEPKITKKTATATAKATTHVTATAVEVTLPQVDTIETASHVVVMNDNTNKKCEDAPIGGGNPVLTNSIDNQTETIKPKGRKPSKKVEKNDQKNDQKESNHNDKLVNPRVIELVIEQDAQETHNVTMQSCELDGSQCDKNVGLADLSTVDQIFGLDNNNEQSPNQLDAVTNKQIAKKRGRKPKGGKIIQQTSVCNIIKTPKPNIILHLKCFMKDLQESNVLSDNQVVSFNFSTNKNDLSFDTINSMNEIISSNYANNEIADINPNINEAPEDTDNDEDNDANEHITLCSVVSSKGSTAFKKNEQKDLWKKLKQLAHSLHVNNISDKKSCCFWDTYEFDNPPVHIPKHYMKDAYQVYGCFCSPECAVAYLMAENIDISVKFERYHLINFIYGKIYNYDRNVKPAPTPHYLLNRFDGNMNIQEYRSLLQKERLYLIVDKPLTRILPELHEDNDDFILNNKIIPSNNFQVNKKIQKNNPTKHIISEQFGLGAM